MCRGVGNRDEPRVVSTGQAPSRLLGRWHGCCWVCDPRSLAAKGPSCLQQQGRRREPGRPTAAQSREWGIVLAHTSLSPADASLASSSKDSAARGPSAGQAVLKPNLHPKRAALCTPSLIPRSFCTWLLRPPFAVAPGLQDAACANRLCFSRSVSACLFLPSLYRRARRGFGAPSLRPKSVGT